jgi:phosphate uptake regulator
MGEAMVPRLTALLDAQTADANAILRVLADIGGEKAFAAISGFKSDNPDIASTIEELLDDWEE